MSTAKKAVVRQGFKTGEYVVYPSHGVGQITAIEEQEVAGFKLELFVVSFSKDKMTLRVPTAKAASVGLRKLADAASRAPEWPSVLTRQPSVAPPPATPEPKPEEENGHDR